MKIVLMWNKCPTSFKDLMSTTSIKHGIRCYLRKRPILKGFSKPTKQSIVDWHMQSQVKVWIDKKNNLFYNDLFKF